MSFTTKELDIVQAYASHVIPEHKKRLFPYGFDTYVRVQLPQDMEAMVVTMMDLFAADRIKTIEWSKPLDWWEAVKLRFAPEWFRRRYPVKYYHHVVDVKAIWAGYQPPPGTNKYGPFLLYVLERSNQDGDDPWLSS